PTAETLLRLASETSSDTVCFTRLYEPGALTRDRRVAGTLRERGLTVDEHPGNLLFEPGPIVGTSGKPFKVFTAFWNACRRAPAPPKPRPAPSRITVPAAWPASLLLEE